MDRFNKKKVVVDDDTVNDVGLAVDPDGKRLREKDFFSTSF